MFIKTIIANMAHKVTGRQCSSCAHNCGGRCCHPSGSMFMKCWHSITRPGYEPILADLTQEEQYQLQKIKDVLQEAEDEARESGLLED